MRRNVVRGVVEKFGSGAEAEYYRKAPRKLGTGFAQLLSGSSIWRTQRILSKQRRVFWTGTNVLPHLALFSGLSFGLGSFYQQGTHGCDALMRQELWSYGEQRAEQHRLSGQILLLARLALNGRRIPHQ